MLTPYQLISNHYSNQKSYKAGVPFIKHIDEGLTILTHLNCDQVTKDAWCLHPLIQSDLDLITTLLTDNINHIDNNKALIIAMEYRTIANNYLSKHHRDKSRIPSLSILAEVNQMLIADKIQNFKDYLIYVKPSFPDRIYLQEYFNNWLIALKISKSRALEILQLFPDYDASLIDDAIST